MNKKQYFKSLQENKSMVFSFYEWLRKLNKRKKNGKIKIKI